MTAAAESVDPNPLTSGPNPVISGRRTAFQHAMIYVFVALPMVALAAAIPLVWGWGVDWHDLVLLAVFYTIAVLGITVGFHRHFTHKAFKARPWLRVAMAITGSLAVQGNVLNWVADHRRHHAFSDREGDPHSPWLFGTTPAAVAKGFLHAHMTWFFERNETNHRRFIPDLLADRAIVRVSRTFGVWVGGQPAAAGRARRADLLVLGRGRHRVLLGLAGPAGGVQPRHLVDQLDLPHGGGAAVPVAGPLAQLLAAGDPVHGRVVAQPAPRRPDLRPARRAPRADRHLGAGHLGVREARLGLRRAVADHPAAGQAAGRHRGPVDHGRVTPARRMVTAGASG
jgi:hypothetical protein